MRLPRPLLGSLAAAAALSVCALSVPASAVGAESPTQPAKPGGLADGTAGRTASELAAAGRLGRLGPGESVRVTAVRPDLSDGHVVRLQRLIRGIPLLGGEIVVDLDSAGRVRATNSETTTDPTVSTEARVSAETAAASAIGLMARELGVAAATLTAAPPQQWLYDPTLIGAQGLAQARLVWRTEVTSTVSPDVRELVLIDAVSGKIALHFSNIAYAKDRIVCDAQLTDGRVPCDLPLQAGDRDEGSQPTGTADTDLAYDYAGDTYDFYSQVLGRDSLDGLGMTLRSTVRWRQTADQPYGNAFWNGEQMVYGENMVAKDVVAHELTHGVTSHTSGLFYYYQSGAINESLSDIFGEYVDLSYPGGNDSPDVRWKIGEDLEASIGIIRDMRDPTINGMPDRTSSIFFRVLPQDSGGVHSNSGVGNKFGYLLADGDTFNGQSVVGLGIPKAARVIYGAALLLTSGSDYADFARVLRQSCASLIGTSGITSDDCLQVDNAIAATEMDQAPPNGPAPAAPVCNRGASPVTLWDDSMDDSMSGRWVKDVAQDDAPDVPWYYTGEMTRYGFPATDYATSGRSNLWGDDPGVVSDASIAMVDPVHIPTGRVFLRFQHAYQFFTNAAGRWDGGVLEYNSGGDWADAGSLMLENGYDDTLSGEGLDNPLGKRSAFIDSSRGYTATRLSLSALSGSDARFRFRIGSSTSEGSYGWFIDDLSIYACPTAPAIASMSPGRRSLTVLTSLPHEEAAPVTDVQYRLNAGPWRSTGQSQGRFTITGLQPHRTYRITVRTMSGDAHSAPSASAHGTPS